MSRVHSADPTRSRFIPVLFIFVSVQGAILISQALASLYLSAGDVGIVRAVESVIAILVLCTSIGAPSLAVRFSAIESDGDIALARLRRLVTIVVIAGLTGWIAVVAFQEMFLPGAIPKMIAALAGVAMLTNFVRVYSAHVQGSSDVVGFAWKISCLAVASVVTTAAMTIQFGIDGWIWGRYVGELLVCAGIVSTLGPGFWRRSGPRQVATPYPDLIRDGVLVNMSLIVRLLADSLAIIGLTALKTPTELIGQYGVASLAMMVPTLIFAVLVQASYPVIVRARDVKEQRLNELSRLAARLLAISFVSMLLLAIADRFIAVHLPELFAAASRLALILSLALPLRALALTIGSYLMATEQYRLALAIGVVETIAGAALLLFAIGRFGVDGAAWLVVAMATLSAVLYCACYWWTSMRVAHAN